VLGLLASSLEVWFLEAFAHGVDQQPLSS
jgi:hypothetical protein